MWGHVISFVLGFAAGCGFKDIIKDSRLKKKQKESGYIIPNKNNSQYKSKQNSSEQQSGPIESFVDGFNLKTISYLFEEYNVELVDANSFSNLLRSIENTIYRQTLQLFVDKAKSADLLYNMLENESSQDIIIVPINSVQKVILSEQIINKLLINRKITLERDVLSETKIQILVSYSVTNGLKSFQKSLGNSMSNFVAKYESGDDVESLYMEIYTNIKDTLDYLEN